VPLSTKLTLALLGVLFLLCPFSVSGVFFLNARFALFLAFILFAGICPRDSNSVPWAVPAGLLTLLLVARIAIIGEVWRSSRQDIADLRILGASLPPGSRVLATQVLADEDRAGYYRDQPLARELRGLASTTYYLPSLWLIERQAFFPLLFADPALHPLEVSEGYRNVSLASFGFPPDYRALADHDRAEREVKSSPYLAGWEQHFDYVVVLNAGRAKHLDSLDTLPLALIGKTDIAALYRIVR
jgi:hypothetical protein